MYCEIGGRPIGNDVSILADSDLNDDAKLDDPLPLPLLLPLCSAARPSCSARRRVIRISAADSDDGVFFAWWYN
jgi:hypothetical protein